MIMINEEKNFKVKKYVPSANKKFGIPFRGNKKVRPQIIAIEEINSDIKQEQGVDPKYIKDEPTPLTDPTSSSENIMHEKSEEKIIS